MNSIQKALYSYRILPDIVYTSVADTDLYLDIIQPDPLPQERMPVVIIIHGGGWMSGDRRAERLTYLAEHGFFCICIDYRLSQQAIFPAQIHDAKAAVRWVRANAEQYHLDADHIGVWGYSSGAHLAALLGTTADIPELEGDAPPQHFSSSVQAVVGLSGPTDLANMGGWHDLPDSGEARLLGGPVQENLDRARRASPITYVHADLPPFLLLHGTHDEIVPFSQSTSFYEVLQKAGADVTLVTLQDENHSFRVKKDLTGTIIDQETLEFFVKHLREQ